MKQSYRSQPVDTIEGCGLPVNVFSIAGNNIDNKVIKAFGDEWTRFKSYTEEDVRTAANMYFDLLNESNINESSYVLDVGCGNGRWTKYLAEQSGFVEAIEPSIAIFSAADALKELSNIRLSKASIETLPFNDDTFDLVTAIGVLHHIPDTKKAFLDCVKKVKPGGHFYCYVYYDLETRTAVYKLLFYLSNLLRIFVSRMPTFLKFAICDCLAVFAYMPFVLTGKFLGFLGLKRLAQSFPLSDYTNKSFFIIRNDALDRFGTRLEHRFSKAQLISLMEASGLYNIIISPGSPYFHAMGKKKLSAK